MRTHPRRILFVLLIPYLGVACRTGRRAQMLVIPSITPAERAALVAALPPCVPIAPAPATWPVIRLTAATGTIRLPPRLATDVDEVPTSDEQSWSDSTVGHVTLQRDTHAGASSGFMIMPESKAGQTYVHEGDCAQAFDGRPARLRRSFWVDAGQAKDTMFIATTDIPLGGDVQLGAGVIGWTRAGRDSLLSALASIRLQAP
jgi:hypothetical protein